MFKGIRAFVVVGASLAALISPGVVHANPTQPYNKCHGLRFKASLAGFPPGTQANPVSVSDADHEAVLTAGDADCWAIDAADADNTPSGGLQGLFPGEKVHSIGVPPSAAPGCSTGTCQTGSNPNGNEWQSTVYAYARTVGHPKHGTYIKFVYTVVPVIADGVPSELLTQLSQGPKTAY